MSESVSEEAAIAGERGGQSDDLLDPLGPYRWVAYVVVAVVAFLVFAVVLSAIGMPIIAAMCAAQAVLISGLGVAALVTQVVYRAATSNE